MMAPARRLGLVGLVGFVGFVGQRKLWLAPLPIGAVIRPWRALELERGRIKAMQRTLYLIGAGPSTGPSTGAGTGACRSGCLSSESKLHDSLPLSFVSLAVSAGAVSAHRRA